MTTNDSDKRTAIFIEGNRTGYGPDQIEHRTMTVADLIDALTEMGEAYGMDARVFLRNDNGYTYGSVAWDDINLGWYDDNTARLGSPDDECDDEF